MTTAPENSPPGYVYLQQLYARLYTHPVVQQLMYGYDRTKHSCQLAEAAFGSVENRVQQVASCAAPIYEQYCQPQVDAALTAYSKGVEGTKYAMDVTRNVAVTTSTLGIGATVLVAQLSLALGAAGANLLFDCAIATKRAGMNMFATAKDAEQAMEQRLITFVQQAQGAAQVPMEKLTVQANNFLDMAGAVVDSVLGLQSEADPAECPLGERVMRLARRLSSALSSRAHDDVIDPLYSQMHAVADQLSKSVILVDVVRERHAWAMEKVDEWHASLNEVKLRVENEAMLLKQKPEEILLRSVRQSSAQLSSKLGVLREKGGQVLSDSAVTYLDAAISYLNKLHQSFGEVSDVYELRDEVLSEARGKLSDLAQWTSKWLAIGGDDSWEFEESDLEFERAVFNVPAPRPRLARYA